jgi:hypothetical protein
MKHRLLALAVLFLWVVASASGVTLYSIANGTWSSTSVWSYTPGGPPCGCFPSSSDNIIIAHQIAMDMNLINSGSNNNGITGVLTILAGASLSGGSTYSIDIRSSGTLNLCGTLQANNVTFSNGSTVSVCPTGNLAILGNFDNKNSSNNVTINGTMTVAGSFNNGNGGVISGTGSVTITGGPVTNTGSTFGCSGTGCAVLPCSYSDNNCGGTPLPVSLLSFTAACLPDGGIRLKWITATEVDNASFAVERSSDAKYFETQAFVAGAGNSSQPVNYAWTDERAGSGGYLYYRLRQADFDGRQSFSGIVAVRCGTIAAGGFWPNPASEQVVVSPLSGSAGYSVRVSDLLGRERIRVESARCEPTVLDVSHLPEGLYVVVKENGSKNEAGRLVIRRAAKPY